MRRLPLIWIAFSLFLALGLWAMGWMTRKVLELEEAQTRTALAAQIEEDVRLLLWRMDSALSPILSQEMSRPYFEYSPVFPADRAYTRMYTELKNGDVPVLSPLLQLPSEYIVLHFQLGPDASLTSPQVPSTTLRKLAEQRYTTAERIDAASAAMERLRPVLGRSQAQLAALPEPRNADFWIGNRIRFNTNGTLNTGSSGNVLIHNGSAQQSSSPNSLNGVPNQPANSYTGSTAVNPGQQLQMPVKQYDIEQQAAMQQRKGQEEYNARAQTFDNNDRIVGSNFFNYQTPGVGVSVMKPLWLDDQTLILARRVSVNNVSYVQGCMLDWPAIRTWLMGMSERLERLGQAQLIPVHHPTNQAEPRMLASIPVRLVLPGEAQLLNGRPSFWAMVADRSPLHVTLTIAWLGAILAAAAVGIMLRGVMALSQRRAGFVSAVTHELRTPLTTLRMYTEMLADGMVSEPEKQAAYHKTLRAEADRLGHLVENVLLYSRLERSTRDARLEEAAVGEVFDRLNPRLTDRTVQAGMMLCIDVPDAVREMRIRANLLSVEQILFNLVDNACKYACGTGDHRIDISARWVSGHIELRVRDHGPGLPAPMRSRLFKPFSKSVQEAANSAPGLGLGLALSYRLARNMNASLRLDESTGEGAAFVLCIPAA